MTAAITTSGDSSVVRVEAVQDVLASIPASRHIVLDLSAVPTLDPEGLGLLVRARQQLRQETGGWLCLAAPSRFVLTVLHTMRLETVFPVFADHEAAVAWLTTGAAAGLPAPLWAT